MRKDILHFTVCFLIFLALRFSYSHLDTEELKFLLLPTSWGVELTTSSHAIYDYGAGYYYPQLNIVIDRSCSGYNFWLICFIMTSFVFIKSRIGLKNYLIIPLSLLLSYVVAIFANVSRITGYVLLMKTGLPSRLDPQDTWLHKSEGMLVYLFVLILFYLSLHYIILKIRQSNEKAARS